MHDLRQFSGELLIVVDFFKILLNVPVGTWDIEVLPIVVAQPTHVSIVRHSGTIEIPCHRSHKY